MSRANVFFSALRGFVTTGWKLATKPRGVCRACKEEQFLEEGMIEAHLCPTDWRECEGSHEEPLDDR